MPIITPTYPFMNSSFNVNGHMRDIVTQKMRQASEVMTAMKENPAIPWKALFKVRSITF